MQMDNGAEFKGVLTDLLHRYGIVIIRGRPHHPQTQGLVEKANGTFKQKLESWQIDQNTNDWVRAIPSIILSMNNQRHSATNKAPYEVLFKQRMAGTWVSSREQQEIYQGVVDESAASSDEAGFQVGEDDDLNYSNRSAIWSDENDHAIAAATNPSEMFPHWHDENIAVNIHSMLS